MFLAVAALALMSGLASHAHADSEFDGSRPLLCAPAAVTECHRDSDCERSTLEAANLPTFISVDFAGKTLRGARPGASSRTTGIENVHVRDGKTLLQGAQNGRAWSLVIDQSDGLLSATISDDSLSFVVFGACTTAD